MPLFNFINILDFTSFSFLVFVFGGFIVFLLCNNVLRKYIVFLLNLCFIANLLSLEALTLYILLSLCIYIFGYRIAQNSRYKQLYFYSGISLLIFLFFLFQVDCFKSTVAGLLNFENYTPHTFVIVYGYSYFLFKSINYLIASYQRQISNYSLINYFNFMFFFSAFTAGPIGRYANYQDEDFSIPAENADDFIEGLHRILNGMIKKYE